MGSTERGNGHSCTLNVTTFCLGAPTSRSCSLRECLKYNGFYSLGNTNPTCIIIIVQYMRVYINFKKL